MSAMRMLSGGVAVAVVLSQVFCAVAEDGLPAVSGPNAKMSLGGVGGGDLGAAVVSGSAALPIEHAIGAQLDGLVASVEGDAVYGVGGHVFWRDPNQGLFGVYGSYFDSSELDRRDNTMIGLEAEGYLERITMSGFVGYEHIDGTSDQDLLAARISAGYYLTEDFFANVQATRFNDTSAIGGGVEWQAPPGVLPGGALFARGSLRDDREFSVFAGVRFYFGDEKTLIRRHREDDPASPLDANIEQLQGDPPPTVVHAM